MTAGHVFIPPTSAHSAAAIDVTEPVPHGSVAVIHDDGSVHVVTPEEFSSRYWDLPPEHLAGLIERVRAVYESGAIPVIFRNPETDLLTLIKMRPLGPTAGTA
jgi:hypothetical protein